LIGNNLVNIASSSIATVFFIKLSPTYGASIATIITTILLLLFGEITPKLLAKISPENFAKATAPFLKIIMSLLKPIISILNQWQHFNRKLVPLSNHETIIAYELLSIVDEACLGGSNELEELQLVKAAIQFVDKGLFSILTPGVDNVGFDLCNSDEEIRAF